MRKTRKFIISILALSLSCGILLYMSAATWIAHKDGNGIGFELLLTITSLLTTTISFMLSIRFLKSGLIFSLLVNGMIVGATFSGRITPVFNFGPPTQYVPRTEMPPSQKITDAETESQPKETQTEQKEPSSAHLAMAYVNEAPGDNWTGSWKNACEEAAITTVDYYYRDIQTINMDDTKSFMQQMFDYQKTKYGSDANSDTTQILELIQQFGNFTATIITDPSVEAIKTEIDAGHPVIALHHGFDLGNKNIPFLPTGSSYHATVVVGYDDATQQFIVHDTGDRKEGANHLYNYDTYMNSLHDYVHDTGLANGPARVLFTSPK